MRSVDVLRHAVSREDRQPFLPGRNQHGHQERRAALPSVGEGGLVAMVAVRNQKLDVLEAGRIRNPPELVPAAAEIRLAAGGRKRVALVQQEDRLELGPRRP